jgi:hypothetical protein
LSINSNRLFRIFKYAVYALLAINVFIFWSDEVLAAAVQFPDGIRLSQLIGSFPATIDTAAWVILLLVFELETYELEDHHFTPTVAKTLQGIRIVCYAFIIYALYGYIVKLAFVHQTTQFLGLSDLCTLVSSGWSYAIDLDEYTQLTAANCATISDAGSFVQFDSAPAVVDQSGLIDIRRLAWVDVINAAVWLLIVFVLEADVWLQERKRYVGAALRTSNMLKVILYSALLLAAIYWGFKGDFVDFWDAFLWLVAFVFIELNVFEWRQEDAASEAQGSNNT